MRKISFGVLGCGNVANNYYLPYISRVNRLVAVCDVIKERAIRSAELWGAEKWYDDPEKLFKDEEVEAVAILTDFSSHASLAIRAAEEGKHFILQKPMGLNLKEAEEVKDKTLKSGVKAVIEPSEPLLSPLMRKLKGLLPEVGKHSFSVWHTGHGGPTWSADFFDSERGGGVVNDLMVYDVARAFTFFGLPKKVTAQGSIFMPVRYVIPPEKVTESIRKDTYGRDVYYFHDVKPSVPVQVTAYDNVVAVLEYDGAEATLISNFTTFTRLKMPSIQIYGSRGSIAVPRVFEAQIEVEVNDKKKKLGGKEIGKLRKYYELSVDHLAECIERDVDPAPSVEWGFNVTRVLVAINESAKTGKAISIV